MKNQKGITLIALIITIIVMLILVTVSITVALQTGLFDAAGKAVKNTSEAQAAENSLGEGSVDIEGIGTQNIDGLGNYFATKNYTE